MPRLRKGKAYSIKFYDHSVGDQGVLVHIVGWFLEEDKVFASFTTWLIIENDDQETVEANYERVNVIKSSIKSCKLMNL